GLAIAGIYLKRFDHAADMAEEKEYLLDIVKDLDEQTKDLENTKGLYTSHRKTLLKRVREIDSILGAKT
ncbi:MAG: hypothetical protein ACE5IH_02160, partial [Thermodesulfobacteriota bacterium]